MQRLGIDLGTDSIGWVLYRLDGGGAPDAIADSGVRIFSGGLDARGQSKAKARREARSARRGYRRRRWRVRRLERALTALGLMPEDAEERERVRRLDPLRLRARALDEPLEPYELGRVLRAFVKRRGFRSNRKADRASKEQRDESKKVREANEALAGEMRESRARTLGEHLWRLRRRGRATRARLRDGAYDGPYPTRAMIGDELDEIRKAQAPHHPGIADASWDELFETILHQRGLKDVEVGRCTFLPEEQRIHRAHPLFQRFRILDEVLNLKVIPPGGHRRALTDEERRAVIEDLRSRKERKFADFHRLGFPEGTRISLRWEAREKIDGDLTAAALRTAKRFGKAWDGLDFTRQQEIVGQLLKTEDQDAIMAWLREACGLDEEGARAVAAAQLPAGTGHLSRAAIERLLPHMEDGVPYHEAVTKAGWRPSDFGAMEARSACPTTAKRCPVAYAAAARMGTTWIAMAASPIPASTWRSTSSACWSMPSSGATASRTRSSSRSRASCGTPPRSAGSTSSGKGRTGSVGSGKRRKSAGSCRIRSGRNCASGAPREGPASASAPIPARR